MQSADRLLLEADAVAEVERQAEPGRAPDGREERVEGVEPVDEHPRLGLEAEDHVLRLGLLEHDEHSLHEPPPGLGAARAGRDGSGPDRDGLGAQLGGDGDRAAVEIEPPLAAQIRDQRRLVLAAGVEQEARARLEDDGEAELLQPGGERVHAGGEVAGERVEVQVVERERDAVVAVVREQGERVVEPVLPEPVRDVGQAEAHVTARFRASRRATGQAPATAAPAAVPPEATSMEA